MKKYKVYFKNWNGDRFYVFVQAQNRKDIRSHFKQNYAGKITSIKNS